MRECASAFEDEPARCTHREAERPSRAVNRALEEGHDQERLLRVRMHEERVGSSRGCASSSCRRRGRMRPAVWMPGRVPPKSVEDAANDDRSTPRFPVD